MPGLQGHEYESPRIRFGVGHGDHGDPALDLEILAGRGDGRGIVGAERPERDDSVAERWIGGLQLVRHGRSMPRRGQKKRAGR